MQSVNVEVGNYTNLSSCVYLPFCEVRYVSECRTTIVKECEACNIHGANVILTVLIVSGVLVTVGNILVIASVVFDDKKRRTKYDIPKASLAFANLTTGVGLWVIDIPNVIWSLRQTPVSIGLYINQSISSPFAMGSAAWFTFLYSSSVYHLLYMSIQRLIGVRCPMRYRNLSYKKVYLHLFFVWCFSTLGSMPVLPGLAVEVIYRPDLFSFLPVLQKTDLSKTGSVLFVLIFISVPFVIMTVLTVITGVTLKRRKRFTNDTLTHNSRNQTVAVGDPESRSNLKNKLKENQGLITLVFLQIGFTGLVVPTFFAVVLDLADVIDCTHSALNFTLLYFSVPSSFVNVFIYIWRDKNFRLFMKRIVKIGTTSNENTSIMLSTRQ